MFSIAVYETADDIKKVVAHCLGEVLFHKNLICDILWLKMLPKEDKRTAYFPSVRVALLSLDLPQCKILAEAIYHSNPHCRIVFYSNSMKNMIPFLHTRPIGFCLCQAPNLGKQAFSKIIADVFDDIGKDPAILAFETREGVYLRPTAQIMYFQSELKLVSVFSENSTPICIVRKMSEVQQHLAQIGLSDSFLRIHQSYIVNKEYISELNKRDHRILLKNGEELPISDSKYESVLRALRNNDAPTNAKNDAS